MDEQTSQYAIVELMGHKTLAGRVTKDTALFPLLRVDVPATSEYPAYTAEYGQAAIYCITYVSEEVARLTAEAIKTSPISVYSPELITREAFDKTVEKYKQALAKARGLPAAGGTSDGGDRFDDDEDEWEI